MTSEQHHHQSLAKVPQAAYHGKGPLTRGRLWFAWLALAAVACFWRVDYGRRGDNRHTAGPLAHAHAVWETNCQVCHVDATPLGGEHWIALLSRQTHAADAQCQSCHAGPAHHANQKAADVPACTSCHLEHKGRQASLTRVADAQCTHCHRNLNHHVETNVGADYLNVTDFAGDHPEFQLWRQPTADPGKVAFNHRLHLSPGMRIDPQDVPVTLARVAPAFRAKYRRPGQLDDSAPVQLDCASCHRTDAGEIAQAPGHTTKLSPHALPSVRGLGQTMLPIVYENHCQACHPLTFDLRASNDSAGPIAVRHRLQPLEIRAHLEAHYTGEFLHDNLAWFRQPMRPLPGKASAGNHEKAALNQIARKVAQAEKILLGPSTCSQCHGPLDEHSRIEAAIPQTWLTRARFDHTSHRGLTCRECHAGADASQVSADVLVPGIQVCKNCHTSATGTRVPSHGGARFDCVQCHRYHAGDHPLQDRGASSRQPARPRDGAAFMSGAVRP